jgi:hypothetical protein
MIKHLMRHLRLLLSGSVLLTAVGCQSSAPSDDEVSAVQQEVTPAPADVLGFESKAGWNASSGTASTTSIRTQGTAAYALKAPVNYTTLNSAKLPSTALAGLANTGAQVAIDLLLPPEQPNPYYFGALQLYVTCASRNVNNAYLGQVELTGAPTGIFRTLTFAVPDSVRVQLQNATYQDLFFTLALNAPAGANGTYVFDNLRFKSSAGSQPNGVGDSTDLVALKSYAPASSTPGYAEFTGIVQIPASFHVKLGSAGTGTVLLDLGLGSTTLTSCTYNGALAGKSYDFASCTGRWKAGDLLAATFARLTIQSGDATKGTTKIKAQLARNPLGDEVGTGLLTPIPTWWGDTADEINQVATAFFKAEVDLPKTGTKYVALPLPEFATRKGNGAPVDKLDPTSVPPANDPPFSKEGHLNEGGDWDAYWTFAGSLSGDVTGGRQTAHFDAAVGAHAVVWGEDVDVVKIGTEINTDTGKLTATGFEDPSAKASLRVYAFGQEVYSTDKDTTGGFSYEYIKPIHFDATPIHIWVFSITPGVSLNVGAKVSGALFADHYTMTVAPDVSIGCHLTGAVDLYAVSGGVDVNVELLRVSAPFTTNGKWSISTQPEDCSATLTYDLTSDLTLGSGGGQVSLVASFGPCPFCHHESWGLFSWDSLAEYTIPLFYLDPTESRFDLDMALCRVPLQVTIQQPTSGEVVKDGASKMLSGSAIRPSTISNGVSIPIDIDPQYLTWTSDNPADEGFPATGRTPQVTYHGPGARTITLTATDQYGETGTASRSFTVDAISGEGPTAYILSPHNGDSFGWPSQQNFTTQGIANGGTAPVTLTWTLTSGSLFESLGTGPSVVVAVGPITGAVSTLTLTATDANGLSNSDSIQVDAYVEPF